MHHTPKCGAGLGDTVVASPSCLQVEKRGRRRDVVRHPDLFRKKAALFDYLRNILVNARQIIVDGADKLQTEWPNVHKEILGRERRDGEVQDLADVQDLVRLLITELETQFKKNRKLEQDADQLKVDTDVLPFQTQGGGDKAIQGYQSKIAELQKDVDKLVTDLSLSEENQRRAEEGQEAMKFRHGSEIRQLKDKYEERAREIQRKHEREQRRLEGKHNTEKIEQQGIWDSEKRKILDSQRGKLSEVQDQHKIEMNGLREKYELNRKGLAERISNMEQSHTLKVDQMEQEHNSARAQWRTTTSELQKKHNSAIAQVDREHKSEQAQLEARMSQMKKDYTSELEKMRENFETMKLQLESRMAEEEVRLKTEFKEEKAKLEMVHAEAKERLQKDVNAYSAALLSRDNFKPTPDNEIKARFLELVQDVDTLARLEWKVDQKEWTNQVLRLLSPNQRLLKKQILQDSVWAILNEYIFCSPFRVFGEEGQFLEMQWNEGCGKDSQLDNGSYTWPKPETETERWRYVTIKECRAALRQPVPSEWDPRAKLKKGFKTSIDALKKQLTSVLSGIANLDENDVQVVEKLTIKAANIWLGFGMQRCRILVVLKGSNLKSANERIRRAREGTLRLVVAPELRRFGDSKGLDLHVEEIVGGCDGETVEVSMRQ
ncbi:hypothetical protein GP486_005224 [Trichoglossum hirsutum]|uniref:Uncharacterized protein n=1 Tax=Trichoglossum hirsutum TaxID=265104 RepID=A0A9P8L9J6_9PEZI|nr:hypothetical protein GP486_005224 [Trichoglossum hirsutum]